ncbi:hypothetical protein [Kordiimonas sp.]|uniref:hypothetical protein n=1 Tax=Kordiimonas sp. TaxID=1970157 RepID=UPI003A92A377
MRIIRLSLQTVNIHHYLGEDDECGYMYEYTPFRHTNGLTWNFSQGNRFITNLKKKPNTRGTNQWQHKVRAMRLATKLISELIPDEWHRVVTYVPIPPSKASDHPEYDERMSTVLNGIQKEFPIDVRNLIRQTQSTAASHEQGARRLRPDELRNIYTIDHELIHPTPTTIMIVDDVLSMGSHFRAAKDLLSEHFPQAHIMGLFLARTVIPEQYMDQYQGPI